jgi:acetyltransferase-like isoleucine patch superfamily enzyme
MIYFKKGFFYENFVNYKKIFFNYILPNLFSSTKIRCANLPRCQQKIFFTGKGIVEIGKSCSFGFKLGGFYRGGCIELQARFESARIKIGNEIWTNNNIMLCAANYIEIGDYSLIGQNVTIMDFEAHGIHPNKRRSIGEIGQVIIGKNTWIGNNVMILKNSEIGNNTIVATGAVVSGKFPANVIIGGVPAKILEEI